MHDAVLAVRNGMSASAASRKFEIPLTTLRKKIATFRITVKPSLPSAVRGQSVSVIFIFAQLHISARERRCMS